MPANYHPTARAPSQTAIASPSPRSSQSSSPANWSRRSRSANRRLSDPRTRSRDSQSWETLPGRIWDMGLEYGHKFKDMFLDLSPIWQAAVVGALFVLSVLVLLMLVYSHRFLKWLASIRHSWYELPGGWLIIFFMIFATSFPPIIGYSTANTIAGIVYGFPLGWPIAASACVVGSLCSFLASRTILSTYVDRMVGQDHRFVALGQVLRKDGLWYLTAIRFCPLPFSLSNGFLATIPSITPLAFALSTAISSPKLLVHVFIGSRLAVLFEKGDTMTIGDKAINYLSMAVFGGVGLGVGYVIYRRTMDRAAELGEEDTYAAAEEGDSRYEDRQSTLIDPEDAAAIMSDDDVSLWDTQGEDNWGEDYNDDDAQPPKPSPKDNDAL